MPSSPNTTRLGGRSRKRPASMPSRTTRSMAWSYSRLARAERAAIGAGSPLSSLKNTVRKGRCSASSVTW